MMDPRPEFADLLSRHLEKLRRDPPGWQQKNLALEADIPESTLSELLNGRRPPSVGHVNRLAWAVAWGYEQQTRAGKGSLDTILNDLLTAAGYSAIAGSPKDVIWSRLSEGNEERTLRVAWIEYPIFTYSTSPAGEPKGIAADLMRQVAELMGCRVDWKRCEWGTVITNLQERKVDVICPILLQLPTRMLQVQFSDPMPEIGIPLNGVVHREHRNKVLTEGGSLRPQEIAVNYVEGEAGQDLCTMFAPGAHKNRSFSTAPQACDHIWSNPVLKAGARSLVNCLVADHTICVDLQQKNPNRLALIYPNPPPDVLRLRIGAAVHCEEARLLGMINNCLRILKEADGYRILYDTPDARKLRSLGVILRNQEGTKRSRTQNSTVEQASSRISYRSPELPKGALRRLGSIHMHIDGAGRDDFILSIVKQLERAGMKGKLTKISGVISGPQRLQLRETYKSHTPGAEDHEDFGYFSTTGLKDRKQALSCIKTTLPKLADYPGVVLEVERVIATVEDGKWRQVRVSHVDPIGPEEVGYQPCRTLPFEIHHAFDFAANPATALNLETLLNETRDLGIFVGGWFNFACGGNQRSCRSNAFIDDTKDRPDYVMNEYTLLQKYLSEKGFDFRLWTIVEQVLGIWKTPLQPL